MGLPCPDLKPCLISSKVTSAAAPLIHYSMGQGEVVLLNFLL